MNILIKKKGAGSFVNFSSLKSEFNEISLGLPLNPESYLEILLLKKILDSEMVKMFIQNADENNYQELQDCYNKISNNFQNKETYLSFKLQFHNILAKGSKNKILIKINDIFIKVIKNYQEKSNIILDLNKEIKEYNLIFEAIIEKDKESAFFFMRKNIIRNLQEFQK